jgi:hypothetical protein
MSATGSVNLIVCFSSSRPFAPRQAENLRQLTVNLYKKPNYANPTTRTDALFARRDRETTDDQRPATNDASTKTIY